MSKYKARVICKIACPYDSTSIDQNSPVCILWAQHYGFDWIDSCPDVLTVPDNKKQARRVARFCKNNISFRLLTDLHPAIKQPIPTVIIFFNIFNTFRLARSNAIGDRKKSWQTIGLLANIPGRSMGKCRGIYRLPCLQPLASHVGSANLNWSVLERMFALSLVSSAVWSDLNTEKMSWKWHCSAEPKLLVWFDLWRSDKYPSGA